MGRLRVPKWPETYKAAVIVKCQSTERPSPIGVGYIIYEFDTGAMYKNTGSYFDPVWTDVGGGAGAVDASATRKGISRLDRAPASAADPVAAGANHPVFTDFRAHENDLENPHGVTIEQVGGVPEAELDNHVQDSENPHGVTAFQTGGVTQGDIDAHANDRNNPHGVTAEQAGAALTLHGHAGYALDTHEHPLDSTEVTPGSYTFASFTVDEFGRLTAASSNSPAGVGPATATTLGVTKTHTSAPSGTDPVVPRVEDIPELAPGTDVTASNPLLASNGNVSLKLAGITGQYIANGGLPWSKIKGSVTAYGAVGDGVTDDTAAIQTCINAEPLVIFPPCSGGYRVGTELSLPSDRTLWGFGWPSRIVKRDVKAQHSVFRNSDSTNGNHRILMDGVFIDGDWDGKTPKEWQPSTAYSLGDKVKPTGTEPTNASGRRVWECIVAGTTSTTEPTWLNDTDPGYLDAEITNGGVRWKEYGPASEPFCVLFYTQALAGACSDITITRSQITNWFGVAYRFNYGKRVKLISNTARMCIRGGFVVTWGGEDVSIIGNHAVDLGDDCIAIGCAPPVEVPDYVQRVTITGNVSRSRLDADYGAGIALRGTRAASVTGNVVENAKNAGIYLADTYSKLLADIVVSNNTIRYGQTEGIQVQSDRASGVLISNNRINFPSRNGIEVRRRGEDSGSLTEVAITGNQIRSPGSATYPSAVGILVEPFTGTASLSACKVEGNTVQSSAAGGIRLLGFAFEGLSVANNTARDNGARTSGTSSHQIVVDGASKFTVTNNTCVDPRTTKRTVGIYVLGGCSSGLVQGNFALDADSVSGVGVFIAGASVGVTSQHNKT